MTYWPCEGSLKSGRIYSQTLLINRRRSRSCEFDVVRRDGCEFDVVWRDGFTLKSRKLLKLAPIVDYPGKSSFPAFIGKSKQLEYFERQSGTEGHNYPTNPSTILMSAIFSKGGKSTWQFWQKLKLRESDQASSFQVCSGGADSSSRQGDIVVRKHWFLILSSCAKTKNKTIFFFGSIAK